MADYNSTHTGADIDNFDTRITALENQTLPVSKGGTGSTTGKWPAFVNLGMDVAQVTLQFSGGYVYYTFNESVLVIGANAVGSDYPICFARTNGYTQYLFHLVHPNQYTMNAAVIVDIIYIKLIN